MSEQRTRLIEVSTELMDTFGGRTLDGRRLSYEWGEPTATAGVRGGIELDVYTPTITTTDDGWLREQREQAATEARREFDVDVLAKAVNRTIYTGTSSPAVIASRIAAEYRRLIEAEEPR